MTMAKTAFDQLVRMRANPGREADTRRLLEALVARIRSEDGPVAYDLFQSKADPDEVLPLRERGQPGRTGSA